TASLLGPLANLASTGLPLLQSTANVGAAVIRGAIQAIDGSRNGPEGIVAGLVNGMFGVMTAGGGMDLTRFATAAPLLQNTALGVGISYDKQNGWGGSLGIGNAVTNAGIRFSEYGGASLNGSTSLFNGIQINGSYNAATGGFGIGANINAGEGPRSGANLNINYDTIERFSGGISYTDSTTGFGMSYRVDREGNVTISSLLNGVVMGTVTGNGYSNMDMDWVQHNINAAQDRGRALAQVAKLREAGLTDEQIQGLSEEDKSKLERKIDEDKILKEKANLTAEQIKDLSPDKRAELLNEHMPASVTLEGIALGALGALTAFGASALTLLMGTSVWKAGAQIVNDIITFPQKLMDVWNGTPAVNPEVLSKEDGALLSAAVYSDLNHREKQELLKKSGNRYDILTNDELQGTELEKLVFTDKEVTGLDSMLVKKTIIVDGVKKNVYIYATGGTEFNGVADAAADGAAVLGLSSQYELAMKNAEAIKQYLIDNDPGAEFIVTGHSLGGGVSSAIALNLGIKAVTFNPAGVNYLTHGNQNAYSDGWNQIDAYITPTDPLNSIQRVLFPFIGPNGRTHTETILTPNGIFNGHSITNFVDHYFPPSSERDGVLAPPPIDYGERKT
ncbi:TIGR04388 family protein, partial [Leptospira idonii]